MDSYLDIAYQVLRAARRPMSAKSILEAAYIAGIVPKHLYGKTQEKTLQARLSEDILYRRNTSVFFRTEPGYYFISDYLYDPNIPEKFKEKFSARRRSRDLIRGPVLSIHTDFVKIFDYGRSFKWEEFISKANSAGCVRYIESEELNGSSLVVWTFSLVRRGKGVLSYRQGRYRDGRDSFYNKRTIGFPGIVSINDMTLFSSEDFGVRDNALYSIVSDLDISLNAGTEELPLPNPVGLMRVAHNADSDILLLLMDWVCPNWFEPTTRRLSINDPIWIDWDNPSNNRDDFEPWSQAILNKYKNMWGSSHASNY